MNAVATIITNDYIHYALALRESLIRFNDKISFYIFITEKDIELKDSIEKEFSDTIVLFQNELCKGGIGKKIYEKYYNNFKDEFRWSMKPVLLKYLIKDLNVDKALYLDCDLFFYGNFDFLFEKLNASWCILTPHWRSTDPFKDNINFRDLLNDGLFNAGFMGINKYAGEILDWWAMVCEYSSVKQRDKGYFNDQGYLNILPVKFDKVEILRHQGCNLASWNQLECERGLNEKGEVLINDLYPIVFIHFTDGTIKGILTGGDDLLKPYLEEYSGTLNKYKPGFDLIAKYNFLVSNSGKPKTNSGFRSIVKRWIDRKY